MSFTKVYTEPTGYKYTETSLELKAAASGLPCFKEIHWPDYATAIVEDTINGNPAVIHLW